MPETFDLVIGTDDARRSAELRLCDAHGRQLAWHQAEVGALSDSQQRMLFDLREYLRIYAEPGREPAIVAEAGVCIAERLLGPDIFQRLWQGTAQRTLRLRLPAEAGALAADLARVPWEIALPAAGGATLAERNLLLRVLHGEEPPAPEPVVLGADDSLRLLFVLAEARGTRPLGAREERLALLKMLREEVYPQRRVEAHFLTHGVTRERLVDQIERHGGYHVLHWSGHGHHNLLELAATEDGASDRISGEALCQLFVDAGGFAPRLVFLSACHSGAVQRVRGWGDFLAVARGQEPAAVHDASAQAQQALRTGFTGTAHALLQAGVPTVVAMRYAVGDDYACALALEFYRHLLADPAPKSASAALTMARRKLGRVQPAAAGRFHPCDHATPLLYGAEQPGLPLPAGRSPLHGQRARRLRDIAELDVAQHPHFVGRTWELARLGAEVIGARRAGATTRPVAVITGLGGMGKTALLAEALALWGLRFDAVLCYQAKPNALGFEALLRDLHLALIGELGRYHAHVQQYPADAISREPDAGFSGAGRQQRLIKNLLRALDDEALLLVIDNFEIHLKSQPEAAPVDGTPAWACQNPAWDDCLRQLAAGLQQGSRSRLLITSRRPLAALGAQHASTLALGPLPPGEAALYLRAHPVLAAMAFGRDPAQQALALRLLNASRLHPLLMDRLARLAAEPAQHAQLQQALQTLEGAGGFDTLPGLFAGTRGDVREMNYLDEALALSIDHLLREVGADARRLLWVIALANAPVALEVLRFVWEAKPALPTIVPLLQALVGLGLATQQRDAAQDDNPELSCHELVRERICGWMQAQPQEQGGLEEDTVRRAYAERLTAYFHAMQHRNMAAALEVGGQAVVYAVQAGDWDRLGSIASKVVTGTQDPQLLNALMPYLRSAAELAPEGRARWCCQAYLADALRSAGRPDASLPLYAQAAALARGAAEVGGDNARQAWSDLGWISGNRANALLAVGEGNAARECHGESAQAEMNAGKPAVYVLASELEALRIDIAQGRATTALPEVEERLARIGGWWQRRLVGEPVAEAPDAEDLARTYLGALDVATDADFARKDWHSALQRLDATLEVKQALKRPPEDIGRTRFNRASVLVQLPQRHDEARREMEACLGLFQHDDSAKAAVWSGLAELSGAQGDMAHAVEQERRSLALCAQLPDPGDRAISHNNLATYLKRQDAASAEAPSHQLAALLYRWVAKLGHHLQTSLHNYAVDFRRAHTAGQAQTIPRVADLLADPAFEPLARWLQTRAMDLATLQRDVDEQLEQVRQQALFSD